LKCSEGLLILHLTQLGLKIDALKRSVVIYLIYDPTNCKLQEL